MEAEDVVGLEEMTEKNYIIVCFYRFYVSDVKYNECIGVCSSVNIFL